MTWARWLKKVFRIYIDKSVAQPLAAAKPPDTGICPTNMPGLRWSIEDHRLHRNW
jgi:hypothetical protein